MVVREQSSLKFEMCSETFDYYFARCQDKSEESEKNMLDGREKPTLGRG